MNEGRLRVAYWLVGLALLLLAVQVGMTQVGAAWTWEPQVQRLCNGAMFAVVPATVCVALWEIRGGREVDRRDMHG